MFSSKITFSIALATAIALAGCASLPPGMATQYQSSPLRYTQPQAQQIEQVEIGTVVAVRSVPIQIGSTRAAVGSGVGALAGGLIGHQVGGGKGKTLATLAGVAGGALAGNLVTAHEYRQPGLAITVQFAQQWGGNRAVQITQAVAPGVTIRPGERVEVVGSGCYGYGECRNPARVIPLPAGSSR